LRDRVVLRKSASLQRCVDRVRSLYQGREQTFETDYDQQDAIVLNLIRACEQAIDMANRVIRLCSYEPADDAKEAFAILHRRGHLDRDLASSLQSMVGFRNIAIHEYEELDLAKVRSIIEHRLDDLLAFSRTMLRAAPTS